MADDGKLPSSCNLGLKEKDTSSDQDATGHNMSNISHTAGTNVDTNPANEGGSKGEGENENEPTASQKDDSTDKEGMLYVNECGEVLEEHPEGIYEREVNGSSKYFNIVQRAKIIEPNLERKEIASIVEVQPELFPYTSRRTLLRFLAEHNALLGPAATADSNATRAVIVDEIGLPSDWDPSSARAIQIMLADSKIDALPKLNEIRGDLKDLKPVKYKAHGPQILGGLKWRQYQRELFKRFPGGREAWLERVTKRQYEALDIASAATNCERARNRAQRAANRRGAAKLSTSEQTHTSGKRSAPDQPDDMPEVKKAPKHHRSPDSGDSANRGTLDHLRKVHFDLSPNSTTAQVQGASASAATTEPGKHPHEGTTVAETLQHSAPHRPKSMPGSIPSVMLIEMVQSKAGSTSPRRLKKREVTAIDLEKLNKAESGNPTKTEPSNARPAGIDYVRAKRAELERKDATSKQNQHQGPHPTANQQITMGEQESSGEKAATEEVPVDEDTTTTDADVETASRDRPTTRKETANAFTEKNQQPSPKPLSIEKQIFQLYGLTFREHYACTKKKWDPTDYSTLIKSKDQMPSGLSDEGATAVLQNRSHIEQEIYQDYRLTITEFNYAVNHDWDPLEYGNLIGKLKNSTPVATDEPAPHNRKDSGSNTNKNSDDCNDHATNKPP